MTAMVDISIKRPINNRAKIVAVGGYGRGVGEIHWIRTGHLTNTHKHILLFGVVSTRVRCADCVICAFIVFYQLSFKQWVEV